MRGNAKPMSTSFPRAKGLIGGALVLALGASMALAAGEAPHIDRQSWSFAGLWGRFDEPQLQRGFQVYKEVCATCHGLKRINFRNLAEPGGPEFPAEGVKGLAESYQIEDGPNDQGKMFQRPGRPSDPIPSPYKNEQEARAVQNGAYPPDLSLIIKARTAGENTSVFATIGSIVRDIPNGYQEGGADYVYALLTGYANPPADMTLAQGMSYNRAFPGHQIAMVPPLQPGQINYEDGTQGTVEQYARDVTAFLAWASDPKLEERKRMGVLVMVYLLLTALFVYLAKRRLWAKLH
jgi:ubiquinol-cytochrome c reductase cytochrome c1 subunit